MGSKTDYLENALLNHILRNTTFTSPVTVWVALYTILPTDSTTGTEVTGGSYAREVMAFDVAAAGITQNTSEVTFTEATAGWGTIVGFAIIDAVSTGNMLYWGEITPNKTVDSGDTVRFATGDLTISED